jgi:hypothetical protein
VSRSVADVFREAGQRHLADGERCLSAFLENLPTEEDQRRFLEAARAFLSFDSGIRNLPAARRSALLNTPIEADLISELWLASDRLLHEDQPGGRHSDLEIQLYVARVLMAKLIVGGLQGASDRNALMNAALRLRELSEQAQATRSKIEGKNARSEAIENDPRYKRRLTLLKSEADKLRKTTRLLRKRDRARQLNKRMGSDAWPSPDALTEFARRNNIKI